MEQDVGETEKTLWEWLAALGDPTTSLMVSHRRPALRRADRIVVMGNGRVLDIGTLDELLERCEEMQWLWQGE